MKINIPKLILGPLAFLYLSALLLFSAIPGWNQLIYLFGIIFSVLYVVWKLSVGAKLQKWLLLLAPFILLTILNGIRSYPEIQYFQIFLLTWIPLLIVMHALGNEISVRPVFYALIFASIVNFIAVILKIDAYVMYAMTTEELESSVLARPGGLTGNPNVYALQAFLPLIFFFGYREKLSKFIWAVCFSLFFYALYVSGSRKALVLALLLLVCLLATSSLSPAKKAVAMLFSAAMCVPIWAYFGDSLASGLLGVDIGAIQRTIAIGQNDGSFNLRSQMISDGIDLVIESPMIGYGLDSYRHVSGHGTYSHNNFIELAVSGGLLLLLSYLVVYLVTIRRVWNLMAGGLNSLRIRYLFFALMLLSLELTMVTYINAASVFMFLFFVSRKLIPSAHVKG